MVEYKLQLDSIFASLSDPIRRDILSRVSHAELSISDLVAEYTISFAAVSKHLKIMERAKLIVKRKEGKKQMVSIAPDALRSADEYLEQYRRMWQSRYDKLDRVIK
jgi:DNA-binding transcriptional ArsR family regulator